MTQSLQCYFAYGSNLSAGQMAERCVAPVVVGKATLPGHCFFIARSGYANLREEPAATVHGLLWRLTPDDLARLDRYEGVRRGSYTRTTITVQGPDGPLDAWIYLGTDQRPGRPVPGYLEGIVGAARDLGFPGDYIASLEAHQSS